MSTATYSETPVAAQPSCTNTICASTDLPPAGSSGMSRRAIRVAWTAQLLVAAILGQTLYFKFTYAPETQVIFRELGGRPAATAVGVVELLCVVLLLVPRTAALGALITLGTISGAIVSHLTKLGLVIVDPSTGKGDGGFLFGLAVTVAAGSLVILGIRWRQLPYLGLLRKKSCSA